MTEDEEQMVDLLVISSTADWPVSVNRIGHVSVTPQITISQSCHRLSKIFVHAHQRLALRINPNAGSETDLTCGECNALRKEPAAENGRGRPSEPRYRGMRVGKPIRSK
jgi:hypothetical protein